MHKVFQQITGMGKKIHPDQLIHAPFNLKRSLLSMIAAEAKAAGEGKPARIIAKLNALTDPDMIKIRKERTIFDHVDIEWGLQIVARKEPQLIHQLIDESYDADTCDRIMQYILFGKQIFG